MNISSNKNKNKSNKFYIVTANRPLTKAHNSDKIKLFQTEGGDEMKKLLLTVVYTNSEGKKTKLNDCLVLKNYGNEIYF